MRAAVSESLFNGLLHQMSWIVLMQAQHARHPLAPHVPLLAISPGMRLTSDDNSRANLCAIAAWAWRSRRHQVSVPTEAGSGVARTDPAHARNCAGGEPAAWFHPGSRCGRDRLSQ